MPDNIDIYNILDSDGKRCSYHDVLDIIERRINYFTDLFCLTWSQEFLEALIAEKQDQEFHPLRSLGLIDNTLDRAQYLLSMVNERIAKFTAIERYDEAHSLQLMSY